MIGETGTYERRCDECRLPYEHVKGAMTGYCPGCEAAVLESTRDLPPVPVDGFHLPFVQRFPDWHWP